MPLTPFQRSLLALLAPNRAPDSYIAVMYDLWQAEQKAGDIQVERFRTLKGYKGEVELDIDLDVQRKRS